MVVLYDRPGRRLAHVTFHAAGSRHDDWFTSTRVIDSSWVDIQNTGPSGFNYFSIKGDDETQSSIRRRFFINEYYFNCQTDRGWLAVIDGGDSFCQILDLQTTPEPRIKYAHGPIKTQWGAASSTIREAAGLAVFVKYC